MAFLSSRRRRWIVLLLLLVGVGAGVWRWQHPRRENPTLAGVPLEERIKGLKDPDEAVRKHTLRTLAAFGPKSRGAMPEVIAALDDRRLEADALLALGRMREDAIPTLTKWLTAEKPKPETKDETKEREREQRWREKRVQATRALGYAGPCAIPLLRQHLTDDDANVRLASRDSLVLIAGEHPTTLPELAADVKGHDFEQSAIKYDNLRTAARDPNVFAIWKKLLEHPDVEVQRFAAAALLNFYRYDPNRGDHYFFDPRLIPLLVSVVAVENMDQFDSPDDYPVPSVLVRLHRAGHPVIPALVAEFRAAAARPVGGQSQLWKHLSGVASVLIRIGPDADRLAPDFVALMKTVPADSQYYAVAFLSAYEKRRAAKEPLLAVGGGGAAAALPPSVLGDLVAAANLSDGRSNAAARGLAEHFGRAVPHIAHELTTGTPDRRGELLGLLLSIPRVGRTCSAGEFQRPLPVSLIRAVSHCLADPKTQTQAIACLTELGIFATSAVPELLMHLDERNFEAVVTAVGTVVRTTDADRELLPAVNLDPDIGGRLDAARTAFRQNPSREKMSQLLAQKVDEKRVRAYPLPLVGFLLEPAPERLTGELVSLLRSSWNLGDLAGADPKLFGLLADADALAGFQQNAAVFMTRSGLPKSPATVQVVLRCVRRGQLGAACALPALYPTETPKEVAELLFALLDKTKPDEYPPSVLWALLKLQPLPGAWVVPDAIRQRGSPDGRRLAAAVALRWNPNDALAADALLAGFVPSRFLPATGAYSSEAAELIAPRAATDKQALTAVLTLIARMERNWWMPGGSGEREFEVLYRAVHSAGPLGTERATQAYLADSDNWALRRLVNRLIADGATTPHAVFQEAKSADKPVKVLFEFVSDETIDEAIQLERANPGAWVPLVSERDTLRFPKVLPTLKAWLGGTNAQLRSHAFHVLSATHPDDPDVWNTAEKWYRVPNTNSREEAWRHIRKFPERALPLARAHLLQHPDDRGYAQNLSHLLIFWVPRAVAEKSLTDPEPRVRLLALTALDNRLRGNEYVLKPQDLVTFSTLLSDPDGRVRANAWDWMTWNYNRCQPDPSRLRSPLSVLPPEVVPPWKAVLRERLAEVARLVATKTDRERIDWYVVQSARRLLIALEYCESPKERDFRDELTKLLPPWSAGEVHESNEPRDDVAGLPTPKLVARFVAEAKEPNTVEFYFKLRAELLRRAAAEPAVARQLLAAHLKGEFQSWRRPSGTLPAILRELAPAALPDLLTKLDQMDRTPGDEALENRLIDLLGDLGQPAADAVPLLLTFAADKRVARRQAAREAIRKIAPDVFAELD